MNLNLKKALLAGTAIVAVGAFAVSTASAADFAVDETDSNNGTYATDQASALDLTTYTAHDIRVDASGTIEIADGEAIGDATTTQAGIVAAVTGQTVTIDDSANDGAAETVTINGGVGLADGIAALGLTITGEDTDNTGPDTLLVDINGNVNLGTGAFLIDSDTNANNDVTVNVSGNITATSTTLSADGADVLLVLDGGTAQLVSGTLLGAGAGEGDVSITNTAGVTFAGALGGTTLDTITVDNNGNNQTVTFQGNVATANGITLGGAAGTDTITANFGGSANTTIAGAIAGGGAGDVINLNFIGGNSIEVDGAAITNIDTVTVSANSTLNSDAAITTSGAFTVNSGSTLDQGAGLITATGGLVNNGTVLFSGTGNLTGNVTGTGTLNVDANTTITGNVTAANTNLLAGDVLTIDADAVDAGVVSLGTTTLTDGTSGLTIISNAGATGVQTISGTITGDDNDGVITLGNDANEIQNYVVNATIGTDAADVEDLIIGGNTNAAVITATLNANAFVDDVDVGNGDVLNLHGTTYEFDTVDSVGGNDASTLNVGSGTSATTLTVNGAIGGAQEVGILNVRAGSTMNITNNLSVNSATDGAINIDGTLVVDSAGGVTVGNATTGNIQLDGTLTVNGAVGTLALGNGSTLIEVGYAGNGATINVGNVIATADNVTFGNSAGDTATLVYNETAAFDPDATTGIDATGDTITFTADTVTTVRLGDAVTAWEDGDVITFIDNGAGTDITTALGDGRLVLGDGGLLTLTNTGSDANTLTATVGYANAANVFTAGSTGAGAANALLAVEDDGDANLDTLRNRLVGAATPAAQQAIAESVAPTADGGFVVAGNQAAGLTLDATNARIELARAGSSETGMVAGQMGEGVGIWGKAFGQMADQDNREGVAGYDADTFGVAVGIDSENVVPGMLVGASFSYADTEVESENVNRTDTEVDSYQFSLYGSKDLANNTYVTGIASYARNNIDQTRNNVGNNPLAPSTANADFDSDQFGLYAELGRDYMMHGGMTLTPRVLANYQHVSFDGYTETGSTANLRVENDDMNIFELGLGATASWDLQDTMGNMIRPSLSAEYRFDTIGDEVESTSSFTGGGASFKTEGFDPAQSSFTVGAGVEYDVADQWTLSGDYDYTFKEDYDAHSLSVRAGYKF